MRYRNKSSSVTPEMFILLVIETKGSAIFPVGNGKVRKIINGVDYGEVDEEPYSGLIEYEEMEKEDGSKNTK